MNLISCELSFDVQVIAQDLLRLNHQGSVLKGYAPHVFIILPLLQILTPRKERKNETNEENSRSAFAGGCHRLIHQHFVDKFIGHPETVSFDWTY